MNLKRFHGPVLTLVFAALFAGVGVPPFLCQLPSTTLEGFEITRWDAAAPFKRVCRLSEEEFAMARGAVLELYRIPLGGAPFLEGTLALSAEIKSLETQNGLLFLSCGNSGLVTVDPQDPSSPKVLSVYSKGPIEKIVFDETGKAAYAATGTKDSWVLDFKKPAEPKLKKTLVIKKGVANDVIRVGKSLLVAGGPAGVLVYSCEDKFNPKLVSREKSLGAVTKLLVQNRTVLAFDSEKGIVVLDYPKWDSPKVKGALPEATGVLDGLLPAENLLITAEGEGGVRWVSFADPMAPHTIATLNGVEPAVQLLQESPTTALLCSNEGGFFRLDFSSLSNPQSSLLLAGSPSLGPLTRLGNWLYIARDSRLETWDFSNPSQPVLHSVVALPQKPREAQVFEGNLLALSCQEGGVVLYDATQASSLVYRETVTTTGPALQAAIQGNLLAVAAGASGIELYDISVPGAAVKVSTWNEKEGKVSGVSFSEDGTLWAVHSSLGIVSLNLSNLQSPTVLGKEGSSEQKSGVLFAKGTWLFQATIETGVNILDISDPSKPSSKYVLDASSARHLYFGPENTIVVSDGFYGLRVFVFTGTEKPSETAFAGLPGYCSGSVMLDSGEIVAVLPGTGVFVLQETACDGPNLLLPCDGYSFTKFFAPLFRWVPSSDAKYILKLSLRSEFDKDKEMLVLGSENNPLRVPYSDVGSSGLSWLQRKAGTNPIYWKVVYLHSGSKTESEVRTFTF